MRDDKRRSEEEGWNDVKDALSLTRRDTEAVTLPYIHPISYNTSPILPLLIAYWQTRFAF